jgi:hypothetical protein
MSYTHVKSSFEKKKKQEKKKLQSKRNIRCEWMENVH